MNFLDVPVYLPVLIFFARIIDVSIGTIRIIVVAKGKKFLASILGFTEVFIWLAAISQIIQNLSSIEMYFGYAAGFGVGTYVGMSIEQRLSIGNLMVRIISPGNDRSFYDFLISKDYSVTFLEGEGTTGPVSIMFTVIGKKKLKKLIHTIKDYDPKAFYTVEDVRVAKNGYAVNAFGSRRGQLLQPFYWFRKSK
ncbi:MAG: DUF2179 domain-containing protein [Calditrichaeota bacterium]|nr:MAG: DUF2179 domain-containing protein [Calditrichota bacterium]